MNETAEQAERLMNMSGRERQWRAYWGLISLTGYAKWKAGVIVLRAISIAVAISVVGAFFVSGILSVPLAFLFGFNPTFSWPIETNSDVGFAAMMAVLFFWTAPSFALEAYGAIREDLEKLTREEGTFWEESYKPDVAAHDL